MTFLSVQDPRVCIFVASIFAGLLVNLSFISGQAIFLAETQPQIAALVNIVSLFIFCNLIPRLNAAPSRRMRYSRYGVWLFLGLLFFITCISFFIDKTSDGFTKLSFLGLWVFSLQFFSETSRLVQTELSNRYVNPAQVGSFHYFNLIGFEIGTLLATLIILTTEMEKKSPFYISRISFILAFFWGALVIYRFGHRRQLEVRFTHRPIDPKLLIPVTRAIFLGFLFFALSTGIFRQFQDFQVKSMIKTSSVGSAEIFKNILLLYSFGSLLTILISTIFGILSYRTRLSPFKAIGFAGIFLMLVQVMAFFDPSKETFFFLGASARGLERGIYGPNMTLLLSFFVPFQRLGLRFMHHAVLLTGCGFLFLILSVLQKFHPTGFLLEISPWLTFLGALGMFFVASMSVKNYSKFFSDSLRGGKVSSILSAIGLSYIRPRGYPKLMQELLNENPKKLLRKTIILGLGYSQEEGALETIIKEFKSDKEEIQLAVMEAVRNSKTHKGTNFILNVCLSGRDTHSLSVRLNAALLVSSLFGDNAIALLMIGLEDKDPRIIANSLEALALLRNKNLAEVFKSFINHSTVRVRANALMGLGMLPEHRKIYREEVLRELMNPSSMPSYLYVIGRVQDVSFKDKLLEIVNDTTEKLSPEELQIQRLLAWSLTQLGAVEGRLLWWSLLKKEYSNNQNTDSLFHFFGQLSQSLRYSCVEEWIKSESSTKSAALNISEILKKSRFDFHDEAEYAFELAESVEGI
jgi:HEAT repeat protein